jgi:hypothetical protein
MGAVLREVVVDCRDPRRVADFWAAALGWAVQSHSETSFWMSASGAPFPDMPIVFNAVPEHKTVKNRVHLDVSPVGCDRDEEVERLLGLGATRADVGQGERPWVVLADPEGNEFCVLGRRADLV